MIIKALKLVFLVSAIAALAAFLSCGGDSSSGPACLELTVTTDGNGTVDIDPEQECYEPGDVVILTALPSSGYIFNYWESDDVIFESDAEYLEVLDITYGRGDVNITANFEEGLELFTNVHPSSAGYIVVDPDLLLFGASDTVILEAFENSGYQFSHWILDDSSYEFNPLELYFGTGDVTIDAYYYILEGEPDCGDDYVDNYNGGCNSDPEVFSNIDDGDMILGTSGTFEVGTSDTRDTDWYEYIATGNEQIEFTAYAEFSAKIYIIDGTEGCDNLFLEGVDSSLVANDTIQVALTVDPGTYWMWIGPTEFSGWPCPQEYTIWFESSPALQAINRDKIAINKNDLSSSLN